MRLRSLAAAALLVLAVIASGQPAPATAPPARHVAAGKPAAVTFAGWPTYHRDNTRAGYDPTNTFISNISHWSATGLNGNTFASPVVWNGLVYVATEESWVYGLNERTGAVQWGRQVATPTPQSFLQCGTFGPHDGITGTPVVDPATGNLYVVAMVPAPGAGFSSQFQLFGLNGLTGATLPGYPVMLAHAGLDPGAQNNRGALAIANGRVYIPFGGRNGDCGTYHPWVISVSLADRSQSWYQPQSGGQNEAGIWAPSGESIDAAGNVYVETGNGTQGPVGGSCASGTWDHGDAVIKLSGALVEQGFFAPPNWCNLNAADQDLGSIAPVLLPNNELFASGKSGQGWTLNTGAMPGFGAPQQSSQLANCNTGGAVFGGFAYANGVVYVPCNGRGLEALNVNTANGAFTHAWHSSNSDAAGAPIVAGGYVWDEPEGGGVVYGYSPGGSSPVFTIPLVGGAQRFTTLAADGDRLFAMLGNGVESLQFSTPTSFTVAYTAYFPWYDHLSSTNFSVDNIHIVNPDAANPVFVNVSIPGQPGCVINGDTINPGGENIYSCATGFGGPVQIQASARVIASQRVKFGATFNEVPALSAAANTLVFPWYDRASPGFLADNIHVVNPGPGTATVKAVIPGCTDQQKPILPGLFAIFSCANGFGGPATVSSTGNPVLASQRVQYFDSFNESPALDPATAGQTMWVSWYDRVSDSNFLNDNIHVVNTDPTVPASVQVTIPRCGALPTVTIPPNHGTYLSCPSGFGGPVKVVSTTKVLVASRVQFGQTFNEVAGQPTAAARTPLYFAWFDRISDPGFTADNVHIVNPNSGPVTVAVTIPPCGTLPAVALDGGHGTYFTCPAGFRGPVIVTSTGGGVLASQRVKFNQSFNEVAAQP